MKKLTMHAVLQAIHHFLVFFLMVAFLISCCTMLFVTTLTDTLGVTLNNENVSAAAKVTFVNVLLLSLLFTVADRVRRKQTVDRPVRQITEAAEKMTQGDFSVRIPPMRQFSARFDEISTCFNKMAQELSGVETLRSDFIANVSHELKTPLSVINNYGRLLQQPDLDEATRIEYATAISHSSHRLAQLITNILKLNKLENQQIFPICEEFDLTEQLTVSLLQFEDAWERKGLNIEADLEENVRVRSDSELLSLVWNNLISNAVKFTPEGGTVGICLKTEDSHIRVTVSDTGCGMSPETGRHIFEKFYQGDTSHAIQGNGLGLALVKRVMDITGGEIGVQSVLGQGSTFTVRIRRS